MGVVFEWAEFLVVAAVLALLLERTRITSENLIKNIISAVNDHREGITNTAVCA